MTINISLSSTVVEELDGGCILMSIVTEKRFRMTNAEKQSKVLTDRKKAESASPEDIQTVFSYYLEIHKSDSKRKPVLDTHRRFLLAVAIHDYGVDGCKDAIDGCRNSHFHMGKNSRGKIYNSLELIFRDTQHIERFMEHNE